MRIERKRSPIENWSPAFWAMAGTALVALIGWVDYATGFEISLSLFYLIPISLTAWYSTRSVALVICGMAAIAWLIADVAGGHVYSMPGLHVWNMSIRLGFFIVVALLLAALRGAHAVEQRFARTDFLTGLLNSRYFTELAERELDRARRYEQPVSVAFLDVDNFKEVNDRFGHIAGDACLLQVAAALKHTFRSDDTLFRLGGDEFLVIAPGLDPEAAEARVVRLRADLTEGVEGAPPCHVSVGVASLAPCGEPEAALREADDRMYLEKRRRKGEGRPHGIAHGALV